MQIAIIENPSGGGGIRRIVEQVAGKRVEYYLNAENLGMVGNWNRCVELARGELVHILHDDDWVLPGYYREIEAAALRLPNCALYATRSYLNSDGRAGLGASQRLIGLECGTKDVAEIFPYNCLYCPGVVVRRSFYSEYGGFLATLVYTADWEMWVRAIKIGRGVVSEKVLAVYRTHGENLTHRLSREARNLEDFLRLRGIWVAEGMDAQAGESLEMLVIRLAEEQMIEFCTRLDFRAFRNSYAVWRRIAPWYRPLLFAARQLRIMLRRIRHA